MFTVKLSEYEITFYLNFICKLILFCELNFSNLVILHSPPSLGFKDSFFGCLYNLTTAVLQTYKAWYKCSYYYYLLKTEKLFIDRPPLPFFFFAFLINISDPYLSGDKKL